MQEQELRSFIKENSPLIYQYINKEILKDIGQMHQNFFVRLIDEYFSKSEKRIPTENLTANTLIYYLVTEILGEAKQAFPFYRKDTLSLDKIFSEAKVYFNYVKFTIENDTFTIALIQTKAGVSTLDKELIKFSKSFLIQTSGLEEFNANNFNTTLDENMQKLKQDINNTL